MKNTSKHLTYLDVAFFQNLVCNDGFIKNYLSIDDVIHRFTLYVGVQNLMTFNLKRIKIFVYNHKNKKD